jgi:hypothetical protein
MFIKEISLKFSLFVVSLSILGISIIQNEFGNVPSLSILWKNLSNFGVSSSLKSGRIHQ